ncbi:hypothetical protein DAPPUDRAFT_256607 [Daphnia pulex]|uniref:Uncharacterized protein n=1 Tax=Daphnia pulex TaxID=6669 RepID=E9HBR8_DAPPU|nr:hypothetical protein DAPPUDRAFT_256607 [Daphnia pulex]|eukprot:EFX70825.1 hypothetical protein DAPPUDRAFT_256607 [Daphnia pulex]
MKSKANQVSSYKNIVYAGLLYSENLGSAETTLHVQSGHEAVCFANDQIAMISASKLTDSPIIADPLDRQAALNETRNWKEDGDRQENYYA